MIRMGVYEFRILRILMIRMGVYEFRTKSIVGSFRY